MIFAPSDINMGDLTINFQDGTSNTFIPDVTKYDGYLFEKSCPSYGNDGQWDALVQGGDVLGMVVGHDHVNDFSILYEGIYLTYAVKSGFGSYWREDMIGGTTINVNSLGNAKINQHYYDLIENGWLISNE